MRLRRISEVALAGLVGAVLGWLIHVEAPDEPRSPAETQARTASRRGDAKPRLHLTEPSAGEVPAVEPTADEELQHPPPDEPARPEPPQRVIRVVDGDGNPVPNLYVKVKSPMDSQRWTDVRGEASVDASDPAPVVEIWERAATRTVELRDDATQLVVDTLPK